MTDPEEKDSEITGGRKKCMRQEKERFFQIIFEENSHVLFRYICGQLNNDRETAKDVLNDVWEVLVVKFETVADLEGEEMTKWLFCVAKNKIKNQRRKQDMGSHAEKPILGLAGVAISGISISSAHRVVISFCVRLS